MDLETAEIGLHSAPVVAGDVVIVGAAHKEGGRPVSYKYVKGYVRAFDVKTGKRLWIFHTIPTPGEYGLDTWKKDSWSYTGNAGVWGQISVDEHLNPSTSRSSFPPAITTAAIAPEPACTAKRWSRSISTPGKRSGIINWCITASGTWTSPARRS